MYEVWLRHFKVIYSLKFGPRCVYLLPLKITESMSAEFAKMTENSETTMNEDTKKTGDRF